MASFNEIARKKVAGVPVLYLAGGAAVILAVVAWKMKSTTTPDAVPTGDTASDPAAAGGVDAGDYSGLATQGTVTVVQQPNQTVPDDTVKTNSTWVRDGANWYATVKGGSGSQALSALTKYVNGTDRSYDEQSIVDTVIKEKGLPPDDIDPGGNVLGQPAKKQFDAPPGVHTITGSSDDQWAEIAALYYGNGSAENQDLLQFANPNLGSSAGPFAIGTKITVPAYHAPKYYTVPGRTPLTWASVASKNGISEVQLKNLNNGSAAWRNAPTLKPGQAVRVA
jgi:hypothetical protein